MASHVLRIVGAILQDWVNRNIWDFSKKSVGPTYDLKGTEATSQIFGFQEAFTREVVTERRAHGLATVYTCINIRSQTISALPCNVIREKSGKKEVLTDHPAYYPLAHQPNDWMSSANMFLTSMIHSDSWGNSFIRIYRDGFYRPISFELMCPWDVSIKTSNGMVFYAYKGETLRSDDVLHFRWFSYDGLCGVSPIRMNANTMGMAFREDRFSAMSMGSKPPGILSYEGEMDAPKKAQNQKVWEQDIESGRTPILSGRWKFDPIALAPGDAEFIQSKKLTKSEIYGIFRIPPIFAQDFERATFANAEQQDLVFVKHTIMPIIRVIEQECNMKLFTEKEKKNHYVKFNLNGLLRGDLAARQAFYQAMINGGVMTRNEARSLEDLNGYEGGDTPVIQGAMVPADQQGIDALRRRMETELIPSASPNGQKVNGHHYVN